ncbi:hypothetical protein HY572_04195 [Candidatus Micrarchaeota archaeon]|nr:hypothetical protein [Candidatus Micrarchaeota archaeon]
MTHNAQSIKQVVAADKAKFIGKTSDPEFEQTTMFTPVATEGKPVINVQRRQEFLTKGITDWREFHGYRALSVAGGIATVLFLFSNPLLAAVSGMGAAWSYGEFLKKDFYINQLYKKRYLLEST